MKPIKTLLVDDDYLVIQDLKKLVNWNELGFQITGTATNGKNALEIVQKEQPDLIVSDISMPVMDGFDFIETIKKDLPDVHIIFISSYASFDYARRAMQNHIHSYILKNEITAQTFTQELMKARHHILQNECLQKEETEALLKNFFLSETGETNLPGEFCQKKYIFFFMAKHIPLEKLKPHFQHIAESGKQLFQEVQSEIRKMYPDGYFFVSDEILLAAIPWETLGKPFSYTYISTGCRKLKETIQKCCPDNVQVYAIPEKLTIPGGKDAFQKLLPYLRFYNSFPTKSTWDISPYLEKPFAGVRQSFSYDCLKKSLGHSELFIQELSSYTSLLFDALDADGIFMLYHNLILQLEELSEHMVLIEDRNKFFEQADFIGFFEKIYRETELYLSRKGNSGYAPWLTNAIAFIKNHYADSTLTVEQIAENSGLSTSRFSVLFRQETGQTVNDYLTEVRISQAVFLLENSNCKIYEIAEKVGYKSSQYFSQVFSQKTGYKPLHFRKKKP